MKLINEPVDVDFIIESKPWVESELNELRAIIGKAKVDAEKNRKQIVNKLAIKHKASIQNRPNLSL